MKVGLAHLLNEAVGLTLARQDSQSVERRGKGGIKGGSQSFRFGLGRFDFQFGPYHFENNSSILEISHLLILAEGVSRALIIKISSPVNCLILWNHL